MEFEDDYEQHDQLKNGRRGLTQVFLAKPVMSRQQLLEHIAMIRKKLGLATAVAQLEVLVPAANEALNEVSLEIRRGLSEVSGEEFFALVNLVPDEDEALQRNATDLDDLTLAVFRNVLEEVLKGAGWVDEGYAKVLAMGMKTKHAVKEDAVSMLKDLNEKEVRQVFAVLCEQGWLQKHRAKDEERTPGYVLGERGYMEMFSTLETTHRENEIPFCKYCHRVCVYGIVDESRSDDEPASRAHYHCQRRVHQQRSN